MTPHARSLLFIGIGLGICGFVVAGAVFFRYGHRWCPNIVIAWSPSADQLTKAMMREFASYPAGADSELKVMTGRFPTSAFAAMIGTSQAANQRAVLVLASRAEAGDSDAIHAFTEMAKHQDWLVRLLVAQSYSMRLADIIQPLCNDPHPNVALAACQSIAGRKVVGIDASAVKLALDYRGKVPCAEVWSIPSVPTGMCPADTVAYMAWLQGDLPDAVSPAGTAADMAELESMVRTAAWRAFASVAAAECAAEMRRRWPTWSAFEWEASLAVFGNAGAGAGAEAWLVEVALADDAHAAAAIRVLVSQAGGMRKTGGDFIDAGPAWKALSELQLSRHVALVDEIINREWRRFPPDEFILQILLAAQAQGWLPEAAGVVPSARRIAVLQQAETQQLIGALRTAWASDKVDP